MTTVGEVFVLLVGKDAPVDFRAYDGSRGGSGQGPKVELKSPEGLNYLLTAPGDLGLARAYLTDNLVIEGIDEV